jgi:hypothetical protein
MYKSGIDHPRDGLSDLTEDVAVDRLVQRCVALVAVDAVESTPSSAIGHARALNKPANTEHTMLPNDATLACALQRQT